MHLVPPQYGVGILLSPQVIVTWSVISGLPGMYPAHLNGMNQLRYLKGKKRVSQVTTEEVQQQQRSGGDTEHEITFSFSIRDGMKLLLSAGRLVTGWIMVSWVKKSTDGFKKKQL